MCMYVCVAHTSCFPSSHTITICVSNQTHFSGAASSDTDGRIQGSRFKVCVYVHAYISIGRTECVQLLLKYT